MHIPAVKQELRIIHTQRHVHRHDMLSMSTHMHMIMCKKIIPSDLDDLKVDLAVRLRFLC